MRVKFGMIAFVFTFCSKLVFAQADYDSASIADYSNDLTIRAFGGYKYAGYKLYDNDHKNRLSYKSNDNFNIGMGFNYRFLGLNVGFKAPFVNNDKKRFGETRFLDLQSYIYMRRFTIDLYAQFYKGYYLSNDYILNKPLPSGTFLLRPDLRTANLGFNAQYIFNHRRFSYRAAFLQNEYQKKSAGSFIAGAGMHFIHIKADSAIIPSNVLYPDYFDSSGFNKSNIIGIAASAGYAHTFVIKKHFFIMASLMGGVGVNLSGLTDEKLQQKDNSGGVQFNRTIRFAAGYNSETYFAGMQFVGFTTRNSTPIPNTLQEFDTGNLRISVAKRFKVKRNMIKEAYKRVKRQ